MDASPLSIPRWLLPAIIVVVVLGFLTRNLPWHLDDYDQAKQAYVSFEMVKEGAWWFQHTPTGRVATKPPLAGWISAGLALATGEHAWDLAWRLPPFAASLCILWLLVKAGRRLAGELGALLAAAAFGLNLMSPRLATLVRTDMLLTLTIFLVGYLVYEKLRAGEPWTRGEQWQIFGLLLASMLIKGPIAYAFLLPGLVALWWLGRHQGWGQRAWSGWWNWVAPLAAFSVWVVIGSLTSRDFYDEVVKHEFLGRFTVGEAAVHHNQPVYFYFTVLLHRFFPWSVVLIALACVPDVRAKLRRDPALCWLACWAIGGLIVMSLVPSKRDDRIFPVIPPFALLSAGLVTLLPRREFPRWLTLRTLISTLSLATVFSGAYAVFRIAQGYLQHEGTLVQFGHEAAQRLRGQRFVAVHGKDEGMLMYLGITHFTKLDDALTQWQAGKLDGLILPVSTLTGKTSKLGATRVELESQPCPDKNSRYALVRPAK